MPDKVTEPVAGVGQSNLIDHIFQSYMGGAFMEKSWQTMRSQQEQIEVKYYFEKYSKIQGV